MNIYNFGTKPQVKRKGKAISYNIAMKKICLKIGKTGGFQMTSIFIATNYR